MATVSDAISSLISTVQAAAAQMVGTVSAHTENVLNDGISGTSLVGTALQFPPAVGYLPPAEFTAPTEFLTMLDAARVSLEEVGDDIPLLKDIVNLTESTALDSYVSYVDKYRTELQGRMAGIKVATSQYFPVAGAVRLEADTALRTLSPSLFFPDFAAQGFAASIQIRGNEAAELAYRRAFAVEALMNSNVASQIDELTARRSLAEVKSLLDFAGTAMNGALAVIRKTIVSPEDIMKLFRQLSNARTSVATGIANNRSAYAGTHLEYVNALTGYYDLFGDLEKVRMEAAIAGKSVDQNENDIKATILAGAAAAAAATAAAGYSAARVGVVLSDKAFS